MLKQSLLLQPIRIIGWHSVVLLISYIIVALWKRMGSGTSHAKKKDCSYRSQMEKIVWFLDVVILIIAYFGYDFTEVESVERNWVENYFYFGW